MTTQMKRWDAMIRPLGSHERQTFVGNKVLKILKFAPPGILAKEISCISFKLILQLITYGNHAQ